jgi:hypothetical protein
MGALVHIYEVRPRKDHRGVDLISDSLPFGRLWYGEPNVGSNAIDYARFFSRSHHAVIRVYDEAGDLNRDARARGRFQRGAFTFAPENGAPKVTMALPPMWDRRYFSNPDGFNFLKPITL